MKYRNALSGKVLSAVLLVATLFFGGGIIIAIANSLSKDNPLHFWLPPIFMFLWFIALLIYLPRGKRDEEQEDSDKRQPDKTVEPSREFSTNLTIAEPVETIRNKQSKNTIGRKYSKYQIICPIGFVIAFGILISSSFIAGGSAVNGKIENGKFFLGEHGNFTEVNRLGYILSTANTFILGVLLPFAAHALSSISWKNEDTKKTNKKFMLVFIVFASFVGGFVVIESLVCCILAILTVN